MASNEQRSAERRRTHGGSRETRTGGLKILSSIANDFAGLFEGRTRARGEHGGPTIRSQVALDLVNLFQADVTTAIGPFLAVYLRAVRGWSPAAIGVAISAQGLAVMLAQTPAGALVDATRHKRVLLALASLTIGLGCVAITLAPGLLGVVATQIAIGIAGALVPLLVAAISLGMVGRDKLSRRIGRNEAFNHAGNVMGAILAGTVGAMLRRRAVFYLSAAMAIVTAACAVTIREQEIDHRLAREGVGDKGEDSQVVSILALARHSRLILFALCVLLFQLGNGALLPLVGEVLAQGANAHAELYMSYSILASQVVMVPIAIFAGYFCTVWGRKPTMLIAFITLPIYAAACALTDNVSALIALQMMGGVTSGILTVVAVIIVNDLARGSGRFNLMEGLVFTCIAVGPSISNLLAGYIAGRAGFTLAFLTLAALGAVALAIFAIFMPETKRG